VTTEYYQQLIDISDSNRSNLIKDQSQIHHQTKARLFRRLAAMVYDAFLLFALTLGYGAVLLVIKVVFHGTQGLEEVQPGPLLQWLSLLGWLVCLSSYYYICWRKQGQTLGMKAWRLRLQQSNGDLATPSQCLSRSCIAPLSLGCLAIGYLWCLLPSQDDCLHDTFSDTVVVLLDK
jgi:uncharacterized RDD family membrane protein YckC